MTIAISGTNGITLDGQFNSASSMGFKNRIINGAMVINQRGTVNTPITFNDSVFTGDRFNSACSQSSKATSTQSSTAPTGFSYSALITSSSAYSVLAGDFFNIFQHIEGFNTADLAWGTASAQTVTLSFWVRSSLTGTFGGSISNEGLSRSYPFTYTINSANTFEYKTITIAGDTTGTWVGATNGIGIRVYFGLGVGSTYSGTAGAWAATRYQSATGATSVVGTNGATFYITGVQLEKGSTATSFDYRPYGTELALCQRYYQKYTALSGNYVAFGAGRGAGSTTVFCYFKYTTPVRATPTITQSNTGINNPSQVTVTGFGSVYYGSDGAGVELTTGSTTGSGVACLWVGNNNSSAYVDVSAEL